MPREGTELVFMSEAYLSLFQDHAPGQYAEKVRRAQRLFGQGSMVSCALSQSFFEPCRERPSALFARLRKHSPAPFTFLMNLGANDYVLGTSPDMFVRVQDQRVETCPISSTLRRGHDAITDAQQATKLLADDKVEAQLTLGADVDRNDKARICEPGSVKVLAHHRMEMSATFIRTFDHVEGILREEFDALDAFSVHAWPVSVTGAPKIQAMQFLEDHEASPRGWYGGAVGTVKFDGALNTGLSLQSIQIKNGVACVRVGTQLRWDSDPAAEEAAAALQAASVLAVLRDTAAVHAGPLMPPPTCHGCKVLVLDLHDAFVHTLVDYLKQTDAEVRLVRAATFDATAELDGDRRPTLVVLASGPGAAKGAELADTIGQLVARQMPILGVGLGLLGLVEFYGGELAQLVPPRSGQCTAVRTVEAGSSVLFQGLPEVFAATHYQTQQAVHSRIPAVLKVTAVSAGDTNHDPVVLAVEHQRLPIAAVQFQPTSIMTPPEHGVRLLMNVLQAFQQRARPDLWKPKSSAV